MPGKPYFLGGFMNQLGGDPQRGRQISKVRLMTIGLEVLMIVLGGNVGYFSPHPESIPFRLLLGALTGMVFANAILLTMAFWRKFRGTSLVLWILACIGSISYDITAYKYLFTGSLLLPPVLFATVAIVTVAHTGFVIWIADQPD